MDLLMDAVILVSVQCTRGQMHLMHLMLCLCLLRACTLMEMALGGSFASWIHAPLMVLCASVLSASRRPSAILQTACCLVCSCAAAAGFALLGGWPAAVLGTSLLAVLVRRSRHVRHKWDIELEVVLGGTCACFPALIDTGNRLKEHKSGLPVVIVENSAAGALAAAADALSEEKKRHLPYGVLGSAGEMSCFTCDEMYMVLPGTGRIEAPPCYLAIYPGRIPGSTRALAPPEFAEALVQVSSIQRIQERARRISNGIFKREAIHLRFGGSVSPGLGLLHRRQ